VSAHTPGPWFAEDDDGSWSVHSDHDTLGGCIAVAYSFRAEANTRLIAAAPDLLDTMRSVAYALEQDGRTADGCTKAAAAARLRASIAKAEGTP